MSACAECIGWWELRRIPFNIAVGVCGLLSVVSILEFGAKLVPPSEDFIEPIVLMPGAILYGSAANAFYTLGWISELLWSGGVPSVTARRRNVVFRAGLSFSVALTLLPALLMVLLWASAGAPPDPSSFALGH